MKITRLKNGNIPTEDHASGSDARPDAIIINGELVTDGHEIAATINAARLDAAHDGVCARAAALLEQQAARARQWQPIETAPKDGTPVLLFVPSSGECVVAACFGNTWYSTYWQDEFLDDPSHWMPLPAAPTTHEGGEQS